MTGWPTFYLIDHKGVIKGKGMSLRGSLSALPGSASKDDAIDELVMEAEKAASASPQTP